MKLKLKIRQKVQILILSVSLIIYLLTLGYIALNARKVAYNDATMASDNYVCSAAASIQDKLNADMSIVLALSNAFQHFDEYDKDAWQLLINKMYHDIFVNNPQIYGLWDSWELAAIDTSYTKSYGRISNSYWRENGKPRNAMEYRSMDGDSEQYTEIKETLIPSISEPYFDLVTANKKESFLMTSLNAPIVKNNTYQAVVSVDITLDRIQQIIQDIHPYEGSYAFLVSYQGIISGHANPDLLNVPLNEIFADENSKFGIVDKIRKGERFNYTGTDEKNGKVYFCYAPILINKTTTPWSIGIAVPVKSMMATGRRNFRVSIFVGFLGMLLLIVLNYIIGGYIAKPIVKLTHLLRQLAQGNFDKSTHLDMKTGDEFEEMTHSANHLIEGLSRTAEFAQTIGQGNLAANYQKLGENDILGNSLVEMRQSLIVAEEEDQKRKMQDEKMNWATKGLAIFGEILREHSQNIEDLSFSIMQKLVDYTGAIQGGIFVKNDDEDAEVFYELTGAIAYNRQKLMETRFKVGESLIGRCAYEKLTIYLEEVPENYVHITSGLGEANPRALVIVPALLHDEVYAIIELVSFKKFEAHEIEFVEKIGESIASTLANARINSRTNKLLGISKQQAEELAAQEEEMRQNMEELQATQEEMLRKEDEYREIIQQMQSKEEQLNTILDEIALEEKEIKNRIERIKAL